MMGKMTWLKVAAQNRRTILKLLREAFFGRRTVPTSIEMHDELERGAPAEVSGEVNA
jgi:hypothetical protein